MAGRLAIDFGTSNTVVTLWDAQRSEGVPVHIPEYGKRSQHSEEQISVIPSVIHYADANRRWIGQQVFDREVYNSRRTLRWMKQYINHRSPIKFTFDGQEITPFSAGKEFLTSILTFALQEIGIQDEEVAFSVPVEAFEHYENWLNGIAESVGIRRFRLIDEPSAAALGYGAHIQPGNIYLIFDFGGGTLHASVVLIETEQKAATGRRCRVLGKAGKSIGGSRIDQWIFQEILRRNHRRDSDEAIRSLSPAVLVASETIKETLSQQDTAEMQPITLSDGSVLTAQFTRAEFEALLDENNLFTDIGFTIRSALAQAQEHGYNEDQIQAVLLVGGSSQIPAVQRQIRQIFGKDKVQSNRPLDAVARGAAAFVAGVDFYDHIQHDYAIRYVNPEIGGYDYYTLVPRGTAYPTEKPVARLSVKGSYSGQKQLGLSIFEVGERRKNHQPESVELVFDPSGAARIVQTTAQEMEDRSLFWMNENSPTFLEANPPADIGQARFEVIFNVDHNKRLIVTARDLITGMMVLNNSPVVRLT